jgi:predicted PurR-regulated permease PerM
LIPALRNDEPEPEPTDTGWGVVVGAAIVVGLVATVTGLYFGRGFLLPVVLAMLGRLVLGPILRPLRARGVPEPIGAAMVLLVLLGTIAYGAYRLADPAAAWIDTAPESIRRIETKIRTLRKPVEQVSKAADRVESIATGTDAEKTPAVTIRPTSLRDRVFSQTSGVVTGAGMTIVLLFFLLASGDLFLRKIVKILPRLDDKKLAVEVARAIESNISRYLLSITLLNVGLGVTVGIALAFVGLPNPVLWGVMVGVLNFVPYVGPLTSQIVLLLVGVMTFDSLPHAFVAPGVYFAIDVVESNFITPAVLGRRLELNPVMIFLAVAFWTWLWGVAGALLAVPLLTVLKIFCDAFEPLQPIGELLSE